MLRPKNYLLKISVEELCRQTSLDYKSALDDISDPQQFVLQGHLYIEQLLARMICALLPRGAEVLDSAQWSFHNKLLVVHSLDTLPPGIFEATKAFNALRNRMAHRLRYQITIQDIQSIAQHLPWGKEEVMLRAPDRLLSALEAATLTLLGTIGPIVVAYENAEPPTGAGPNA